MDKSIINRFWAKVDKQGENDCWEWTAANSGGYGTLRVNRKTVKASRISWVIHNGEIPHHDSSHGMCVLHKCDNPGCVNPNHLFLGTNADNVRDRDKKGRGNCARGEDSPHAKLTESKVRVIRAYYPSLSQVVLAKIFGVTKVTISEIVLRKKWKHI